MQVIRLSNAATPPDVTAITPASSAGQGIQVVRLTDANALPDGVPAIRTARVPYRRLRGSYVPGTEYSEGDEVIVSSGSWYLSLQNGNTDEPGPASPNWALSNIKIDVEFAPLDHTHDGVYSPVEHDHAGEYAPSSHNHNALYAGLSHAHSEYASASHDHDGDYSGIDHTHTGFASTDHAHTEYSLTTHDHDDAYAGMLHAHTEYADTDHEHTEYAAASHDHGGIYAEAEHAHTGYAAVEHVHSEYAEAEHTHTGYASASHNHDETYAGLDHTHTGFSATDHTHAEYSLTTHDHDEAYAEAGHTHTGFASSDHDHDETYAGLVHTHTEYSATSHNHDDAYAGLEHIHTGYAIASHDHDESYSGLDHTHTGYASTSHDHDEDYAPLAAYAPLDGWQSFGNATATSAAGFSVTDNAANQVIFVPGRPLKMVSGSTTTYHIIEDYTTGAVTLSGGVLTASTEYAVSYGDFPRLVKMDVHFPGAFAEAATSTAIASLLKDPLYWDLGPGVLCAVKHIIQAEDSAATTTQPAINVSLGGTDALSADDETATTRQMTTCNAEVEYGDVVEIEVVQATGGTPGHDAEGLSISLLFVLT